MAFVYHYLADVAGVRDHQIDGIAALHSALDSDLKYKALKTVIAKQHKIAEPSEIRVVLLTHLHQTTAALLRP